MSTSVLYDVPGPRAIARNRVLAVVTVVIVAAVIGFLPVSYTHLDVNKRQVEFYRDARR